MAKYATKRKDPGGIMILGMLVTIALFLLLSGSRQFLQRIDYMQSALPAMGQVVSVLQREQRKGRSNEWVLQQFPIVEFETVDGRTLRQTFGPEHTWQNGDNIALLYQDLPPHRPLVDAFEFTWGPSLMRLAFGLLLIILAVKLPIWRKISLMSHFQHWRKRNKQ